MWQQYTYNGPRSSHLYSVYTPTKYQVGSAVPLVVMLHGCTQTARDFAAGTQMNQLAEEYGFVVVYPQQTRTYNQNLCWNWFAPANQYRGSGEPAILAGIVQTMKQEQTSWSIDPRRVYVAGHSAGAAMAVILGATYPDLFAAIGVHSGLQYRPGRTAPGGRCKPIGKSTGWDTRGQGGVQTVPIRILMVQTPVSRCITFLWTILWTELIVTMSLPGGVYDNFLLIC